MIMDGCKVMSGVSIAVSIALCYFIYQCHSLSLGLITCESGQKSVVLTELKNQVQLCKENLETYKKSEKEWISKYNGNVELQQCTVNASHCEMKLDDCQEYLRLEKYSNKNLMAEITTGAEALGFIKKDLEFCNIKDSSWYPQLWGTIFGIGICGMYHYVFPYFKHKYHILQQQ